MAVLDDVWDVAKMTAIKLGQYLEENKIIVEEQRGFRKGRGTEDLIQMLFREWREEAGKNKVIIAAFLDFKRAFETIDRGILLNKLKKIGIEGKALNWFINYLSLLSNQL